MEKKLTVAVVDDEPDALDLYARTLLPKYEVSTFSNPEMALAAICAHPPALLLTDHKMPRMNGFELGQRVREAAIECPLLMVTAFPEVVEVLLQRCEVNPFFQVIPKPCRPEELLAVVAQALSKTE